MGPWVRAAVRSCALVVLAVIVLWTAPVVVDGDSAAFNRVAAGVVVFAALAAAARAVVRGPRRS